MNKIIETLDRHCLLMDNVITQREGRMIIQQLLETQAINYDGITTDDETDSDWGPSESES